MNTCNYVNKPYVNKPYVNKTICKYLINPSTMDGFINLIFILFYRQNTPLHVLN